MKLQKRNWVYGVMIGLGVSCFSCSGTDDDTFVGLWTGSLTQCVESQYDGAEIRMSVRNATDDEDLEQAWVSSGIPVAGNQGATQCQTRETSVDGYTDTIEFVAFETCDGFGEVEYTVDLALDANDSNRASGTLIYAGEKCEVELTRKCCE